MDISNVMRTICAGLEKPVIVILIIILIFTLVLAGSVIAEYFTNRRHLKVWMPRLVDDIKKQEIPPALSIKRSGLLKHQKIALIEVTDHKELSNDMREALAYRIIDEEKARYEGVVKLSDLVIRIGPVFGLLGTLIPLGPGIIALGKGDTYTLSQSLLTAFDTTILGLISAAICTVISMVRKRWYSNDMSILETIMECLLEVENKQEGSGLKSRSIQQDLNKKPLTDRQKKTLRGYDLLVLKTDEEYMKEAEMLKEKQEGKMPAAAVSFQPEDNPPTEPEPVEEKPIQAWQYQPPTEPEQPGEDEPIRAWQYQPPTEPEQPAEDKPIRAWQYQPDTEKPVEKEQVRSFSFRPPGQEAEPEAEVQKTAEAEESGTEKSERMTLQEKKTVVSFRPPESDS